jgi:hypothetical protein
VDVRFSSSLDYTRYSIISPAGFIYAINQIRRDFAVYIADKVLGIVFALVVFEKTVEPVLAARLEVEKSEY